MQFRKSRRQQIADSQDEWKTSAGAHICSELSSQTQHNAECNDGWDPPPTENARDLVTSLRQPDYRAGLRRRQEGKDRGVPST